MFRTLSASVLLLLVAAPGVPHEAVASSAAPVPPATYPVLDDLRWYYEPSGSERFAAERLRITRKGHTVTFDPSETLAILGDGAAASLSTPGGAMAFSLARPAGALACSGRVEADRRASGSCRFDPDEGFVAALAERGLTPEDSEELMSLALVDARVESVDELSRAGYAIDDVETVIAISALEVTAAFARELRAAGLAVPDVENLIAAKAVGVEPGWLRAMAEAGYPNLGVSQAIELRALDVTPDYARRMARVGEALEESQAR